MIKSYETKCIVAFLRYCQPIRVLIYLILPVSSGQATRFYYSQDTINNSRNRPMLICKSSNADNNLQNWLPIAFCLDFTSSVSERWAYSILHIVLANGAILSFGLSCFTIFRLSKLLKWNKSVIEVSRLGYKIEVLYVRWKVLATFRRRRRRRYSKFGTVKKHTVVC